MKDEELSLKVKNLFLRHGSLQQEQNFVGFAEIVVFFYWSWNMNKLFVWKEYSNFFFELLQLSATSIKL